VLKDRFAPVNLLPACRKSCSSDDESTWKFGRNFDRAGDIIDGSPDLKETFDSGYLRHACRSRDDDRIMSLVPSNDQDIEEHEGKDEAHQENHLATSKTSTSFHPERSRWAEEAIACCRFGRISHRSDYGHNRMRI
jgi:hypothetical protein